MLIALVIVLWFLCGLAGIHLAFAAARSRQENFDPVHIWLAILGPISLVLAGITYADGERGTAAEARQVAESEKLPARFPPASVGAAAMEEGRRPFRATGA
jgi:hypothetical protein